MNHKFQGKEIKENKKSRRHNSRLSKEKKTSRIRKSAIRKPYRFKIKILLEIKKATSYCKHSLYIRRPSPQNLWKCWMGLLNNQ